MRKIDDQCQNVLWNATEKKEKRFGKFRLTVFWRKLRLSLGMRAELAATVEIIE